LPLCRRFCRFAALVSGKLPPPNRGMSEPGFFLRSDPPTDPAEFQVWLNGIVRLEEGARLRHVHKETLSRDARSKGKLIPLGKRAVGVTRRFALGLD
jgi:hypothetical protein